jgi:AcrR family transcriptional regulator
MCQTCDTVSTRANPPNDAAANASRGPVGHREAPRAASASREPAGRRAAPSPDSARRGRRVPAEVARRRILEAARRLLEDRPFGALTVGDVMAEAGLTRTIFYRLFDDLPALAADLLPDSDDPLIDQVGRLESHDPEVVVPAMIDGLVAVYAENGRLLQAMADAARQDPVFAAQLDTALEGPRALLTRLVQQSPHPPPDPAEFARMLMTVHREYLLDRFGDGDDSPEARAAARDALQALWDRLLS